MIAALVVLLVAAVWAFVLAIKENWHARRVSRALRRINREGR